MPELPMRYPVKSEMLKVERSMLNVEWKSRIRRVAEPSFNIEHSTLNIQHSLLTLKEVSNA